MTVRVVQWATGSVGSAQLREIIDSPQLELAGVFVYDCDKVGVDAGTLVGRPDTGIVATNDRRAIIGLDADLVLHAASKAGGQDANTNDIVALLESGKDVVTTTSYNHLPTFDEGVHQRILEACRRSGARFHAAGEHPGFVLERLAVSLTALSRRVDRITVQEYVDCRGISNRAMLVDLMGMGKDPSEIGLQSPMYKSVSLQYEQAIGAAAQALGIRVDEVRAAVRTGVSPRDVTVACGTLPAGTVVGQELTWTGYASGVPVLVCEEYWTVTDDIPGWDLGSVQPFLVRIRIDGSPPLQVDLVVGNDCGDDLLPGVAGGQLAVAMTAVRSIPYVRAAQPGPVTPSVFGAYRWPTS